MEDTNLNYSASKSLQLHDRVSTLTVKGFSRRLTLQFLGINHIISCASPALAAPVMTDMKEPEVLRFVCSILIFVN